ncbi:alpha/beta hydrolase [Nocardioides sp. TF02-7]|uniref:alpha/beta fold hydrolase n=1 Tax=Nocardioides sp. TF02-7 TaxID=2917724 RepID=UPI001F05E09F|nr:alpha/beta hydrolase [Nocardioides sp. TF02-7]UMG93484.1 alpha/beta hydrolase [Nocardioides sp. TF02-7]
MDVHSRLNVTLSGVPDGQPMLFAHGFGCDQHMWRLVTPAFADAFRLVLFDHAGCGGTPAAAWDPERYSSLQGYAADVLDLVRELDLRDVVLVGHSVSAMIGALAVIEEPERFDRLVMVGPSPRYVDDPAAGYVGGFGAEDIDELLDSLASNYLGWSAAMAPAIMGNPDRPELGAELSESFCRMDPAVARRWAETTFLSDNRADLPRVGVPTLVLQCREDVIAPVSVGEYVHAAVPGSELVLLDATGHCPNLSAPDATVEAIRGFVRGSRAAG